MDVRCKRIKKCAFTDVDVYVWTGPKDASQLDIMMNLSLKRCKKQTLLKYDQKSCRVKTFFLIDAVSAPFD